MQYTKTIKDNEKIIALEKELVEIKARLEKLERLIKEIPKQSTLRRLVEPL